jgi:hypothetical protein
MADYTKKLIIEGADVVDIINNSVTTQSPKKTSELTNDASLTTTTGKAASATKVNSAGTITAASGVTAGSYGATGNATLNNNTVTVRVPQINVNAQGLVTSVTNRTLSITSY